MKHWKSCLALLFLALVGCTDGPTTSSAINRRPVLTAAQKNDSNNFADPSKPDDFANYYFSYAGERERTINTGGEWADPAATDFTPQQSQTPHYQSLYQPYYFAPYGNYNGGYGGGYHSQGGGRRFR